MPATKRRSSVRRIEIAPGGPELAEAFGGLRGAIERSRTLHDCVDPSVIDSTFARSAVTKLEARRIQLAVRADLLAAQVARVSARPSAPQWLVDEVRVLAHDVEHLASADCWVLQELMLRDMGESG